MRPVLTALPLLMLAVAAEAAEVPAVSRIGAVTVYPSGAEVQRTLKVRLERGDHVVVVPDLPAEAVAASLRVAGKANAQLEIGSVDSRRVKLQTVDAAALAAERKRIEDDIERLRDQRSALETLIETAQTQKQLIVNLTDLPKRPPAPAQASPIARQDEWSQVLSLIGTGMTDVHRTVLETSLKIREVDRRMKDLEKKLAELAPTPRERIEVRINVAAAAPLEADLVVTYQVRSASWVSLYDARLDTGSKTQAPKLVLTRRAVIQQRTGEVWSDVTLALSTTRPAQRAAAPDLSTMTVDFEPERRPPPAPVASAPVGGAMRRFAQDDKAKSKDDAGSERLVPLQEAAATVEASSFQAVFTPAGRTTVAETGEAKRLFIDEHSLDTQLVVRTVPKLDASAYLYAKSTLPRGTPYLAGAVSLFRDGSFVGTGRLPQLAPGVEHELGFGADDLVRVQYAVLDDKRGEAGIISSARTDQRSYKITVKNLHVRQIAVSVRDQAPVSLQQDIKVELIGKTQPTRRDIEDKRGVFAWEQRLEPDAEAVIDFGYRVSWPAAKAVQYGR